MRLHVVGAFFSSFLPGQIGADLYRVVALKPLEENTARLLTLVFLPRMVGMLVLLFAAMVSGPLYGGQARWFESIVFAGGAAAALALLAGSRLRSGLLQGSRDFLSGVRRALLSLTLRQVFALLGLSFLIMAARAAVLWALGAALDCVLSFGEALFVVAFATLIAQVPVSFAGLGLREGAVVLFLISLQIPYEKAIVVAFLGRAFILLLSGTGGFWLIGRYRARPKNS